MFNRRDHKRYPSEDQTSYFSHDLCQSEDEKEGMLVMPAINSQRKLCRRYTASERPPS
jgi:hypothetical protein